MGEPSPDPLGGDHSAGLRQRTGDDTLGGALQPRWRTESSWLLLDCCDEEARQGEGAILTDL